MYDFLKELVIFMWLLFKVRRDFWGWGICIYLLVIRKKIDKSSRNLSANFIPFSMM